MDKERVLRDQTVVTSNGTIVAIGPASSVKVPRGAVRVDATGKYLLPALCDMHVHLLSDAWNMMMPPDARLAEKDMPYDQFLLPYVANGVTTVMALSATPQEIRLRSRIERGEVLGPRLILGRMIDGPGKAWPPPLSVWVANPEEARQAVIQAKRDGYDKIKVYSFLSKESYDAIIATAKEQGIDVIGHVPNSISLEYALDSGQKLIAHSEELSKKVGGKYSPDEIEHDADIMVAHGEWMIATLMTTRTILDLFDDPQKTINRPEAVYYRHPLEQGVWSFVSEKIYGPIPANIRTKIRNDFEQYQRPMTKAFNAKGGKILAGSDTILPGIVPGFSLHEELRELVDDGLTPYQALRAATAAPFEYLGESDKAGTVEAGKHGDLLLVDANPLDDISATLKISGVLIRGRWIAKQEIDRKMQELATAYPAPAATASRDGK